MVVSSYPYVSQPTTDLEFSRMFRELQDDGVVGSFGDASLRVTANSTGLKSFVNFGSAFLRGFFMRSTEVTEINHTASSVNRIDTVLLRFDLSKSVSDRITIAVKEGAPSASNPLPPTLVRSDTGVWEEPLGDVLVGGGVTAIAPAAVTDRRSYIGNRLRVWNNLTRPAAPRKRALGFNESTLSWEFWNGTAWEDLAPVVTWANISGKPSTFVPSTHTHTQAQVTGLTDAIAGRAPLSHTHAQADISGLVSALNGKAATSHTHQASQVTRSSTRLDTWMNVVDNAFDDIRTDVNWLNSNWNTKANVSHTHNSTQVSHAGTRLDAWWNSVDSSFDNVRRDIAWLNANYAVASGPTAWAYGRNAGDARYAVYMDGGLGFGRNVSSRRYKEDIVPAEVDVAAVLALQPVTYHRKNDPEGVRDFGLIAEDSVAVDHLVIYDRERDEEGNAVGDLRPEAVRYEQTLVVALLAVCQSQQAQIDELTALVKGGKS